MSPAVAERQKQLDAFKAASKQNAKTRIEKFNEETNSTPVQRVFSAVKGYSAPE